MRRRAMTLSIYTVTDNAVTLHQSERHRHTFTRTTYIGTEIRGIHLLHHVINPTLPPTDTKEAETLLKEKLKGDSPHSMLIFPYPSLSLLPPSLPSSNFTHSSHLSPFSTFLSSLHQSILYCSFCQPELMSRGS